MSVSEQIRAYHGGLAGDKHHRYRSWEHCYGFFQGHSRTEIFQQRDTAALQLGFYLASWGMYRGSSFLLQSAYTVHLGVIDRLVEPGFSGLWEREIGSDPSDVELIPIVLNAAQAVRDAYADYGEPTDTLLTKILLGTFGCLPACDRYFIEGFKNRGFSFAYLNFPFVERILHFCTQHVAELRSEQARIKKSCGVHYPLMKLVDMYFWQIGYDLGTHEED
jgi:hypothetical protein